VIAKFIKFEESDESQIEMANLNNKSIISLDFNSIKLSGPHTTSAGHVFTGVVTSDKTTWIASNMVTTELLNAVANGPLSLKHGPRLHVGELPHSRRVLVRRPRGGAR